MTAPARDEAARRLRKMADAIAAGSVPVPSPHWALVFRTGDPAQFEVTARALGIDPGDAETVPDEDGALWLRLRDVSGGIPVEVTAASVVMLEPLSDTDPSIIRRTYALGGAA
jgi:hypothetical protein